MSTAPTTTRGRIEALHEWFAENVLAVRLTPERERRWFAYFKQGFTEGDLREVIVYLRRQITAGKRNQGALKLENLLKYSDEDGNFSDFENDLALAQTELLRGRKLAPAPGAGEAGVRSGAVKSEKVDVTFTPPPSVTVNPEADRALAEFRALKGTL
jgi:hypothetical protein